MSSYSPVKFTYFLKSRLLFNILYCFCMFVNKHFAYLWCTYLKKWKCYNAQSTLYYFYTKTNLLQDFHICISVTFRDVFRNLSDISDGSFCENNFRKTLHLKCLTGFWIRLLPISECRKKISFCCRVMLVLLIFFLFFISILFKPHVCPS